MRRFACNEGVDLFSSNAVHLRTSAARYDANRMRLLRAEVERLHGAGQHFAQFADELFSWQRSARFQANEFSFLFKKWRGRFQSDRRCQLGVVANLRMDVERKMRAVKRDVVFQREF